ncbi:hypothetical protein A3A70_01070 [candidate division WWE3 bacterium RIFCSPLOWO2_01_FULL_42_11]|uniref:Uncharacterized protein n=1 Tax=candidate division WWE3 bacterium RIFCSPLOWO2_01_FULL_42_11 TaxID=1802627 RepID=A0A1F4VRU2_UNCKA|nr:MAG: hypothetical protein A3A70_01070 [candidate division WWE3 bacterium RIFCSPLOWO2_01_FULL_42_11]
MKNTFHRETVVRLTMYGQDVPGDLYEMQIPAADIHKPCKPEECVSKVYTPEDADAMVAWLLENGYEEE